MLRTWRVYEHDLVLRGLEPALARDLMWSGVRTGSLKVISQAAMIEDQVLDGQITDNLIVVCISQALPASLVITSPVSGMQDPIPATLHAFKLIIAAACARLCIISPYIDDVGVKHLAEPIQSAAERKVEIRLLTRETEARQAFRTRGLAALARLAGSRLAVRDYHTRALGLSHLTSVHAKLILADGKLGYVGSAEIRGNALEKNFEMGTVIREEVASQAVGAFEAIWQVAKAV